MRISGARSGPGVCAPDGEGSSSGITTLILPAAPSTNALFKNIPGKGRVRTKMYEDWLGHAGWQLRLQRPQPVMGNVVVIAGVERTSASADIDNRLKASLDLLVKHQVIEDDSKIIGLAIAWSPPRDRLMRLAIIPAANLGVRFQLATDGATGGWYLEAPISEQEPANGY